AASPADPATTTPITATHTRARRSGETGRGCAGCSSCSAATVVVVSDMGLQRWLDATAWQRPDDAVRALVFGRDHARDRERRSPADHRRARRLRTAGTPRR